MAKKDLPARNKIIQGAANVFDVMESPDASSKDEDKIPRRPHGINLTDAEFLRLKIASARMQRPIYQIVLAALEKFYIDNKLDV